MSGIHLPIGGPIHFPIDGGTLITPGEIARMAELKKAAEKAIALKAAGLPWIGAPKGDVQVKQGHVAASLAYFRVFEFATIYAPTAVLENRIIGTYEIHGLIRDYQVSLGGIRSIVGYPLSDELDAGNGRGKFNRFQNGVIYWAPQTGAHEVYGNIWKHWNDQGAEKSWLGFPVTGELGIEAGRMSSFENGQVLWRNGSISAQGYKDNMMQRYNGLGGILSPLGLPKTGAVPAVVRAGNTFLMSFRGGDINVPVDKPTASAISTQTVQVIWTGLECQVKQESHEGDELVGGVSLLVPSTATSTGKSKTVKFPAEGGYWQMGRPNERIINRREVLYEGPPTDVILLTSLVELDTSAGNATKVMDDIATVLTEGAKILQTVGAAAGSDVAVATSREAEELARKYKEAANTKIFQAIVRWLDSPDDAYPAGYLSLSWEDILRGSVPKKVVRRDDDSKTITYTHYIMVEQTDNGGDLGRYLFYFDINVFNVRNPL